MISFVIPAKNEEKYIAGCLHSIYKQTAPEPIEIIVVDNASTDSTEALIRRLFPQVTVVYEGRPGTNRARQTGFAHSRGELICFLDADTRLPPWWLEKLLASFQKNDRIVAVSGPYRFYDFPWYWNLLNELFMFLILTPFVRILELTGGGAQMMGGNMVIKRSALRQIGGFNTSLKFYGDDSLTALQLRRIGRVIFSARFCIYSSARRYLARGVMKTSAMYILNYFWILIKGRPYHEEAEIIR